MSWFVNLDSTIVVKDEEAATAEQAVKIANKRLQHWLKEPAIELDWNVEHEE